MHSLDFPLWLRALHFCNLLFVTLLNPQRPGNLERSSQTYWNDNCTPGSEWLNLGRHPGRSTTCTYSPFWQGVSVRKRADRSTGQFRE